MTMRDTWTVRRGTTLQLRSVNPDAIYSLYREMGFYDELERHPDTEQNPGEWAAQWNNGLSFAEKARAAEAVEKLFNYCAGWGVETEPPEEAQTELNTIGKLTENPRQARISWLRFLLLYEDEIDELIGRVMALSQMSRIGRLYPAQAEVDTDKINELEAEVERLKAQLGEE